MRFFEKEISIPKVCDNKNLLPYLANEVTSCLEKENLLPLRVAVTDSLGDSYKCEVGVLETQEMKESHLVFEFRKRKYENERKFNVVFLVPTGIGCELGGHAGDATPVARLISSVCDTLITHPNVFNASDINEMPENSLYVEGSSVCRLLMGTLGLRPVRKNRILALIDENQHTLFENASLNSVNAARATLGLECTKALKLAPSLDMTSQYSSSERAVGLLDNIENVYSLLEDHKGSYDAVAISSVIKVPKSYHINYFKSEGSMVNPWGGVEAMLTHALSFKFNVPSAHSPMLESPEIANLDTGVVDSRMSAEAVSTTFLHCVLKGLHKSPKLITDKELFSCEEVFSVEDISCLVVPDSCLGLPTLAALEQGIKVISVKENKNLMKNELSSLPWKEGQFTEVENYLEAIGALKAMKEGLSLSSLRRPFHTVRF